MEIVFSLSCFISFLWERVYGLTTVLPHTMQLTCDPLQSFIPLATFKEMKDQYWFRRNYVHRVIELLKTRNVTKFWVSHWEGATPSKNLQQNIRLFGYVAPLLNLFYRQRNSECAEQWNHQGTKETSRCRPKTRTAYSRLENSPRTVPTGKLYRG